MTYKIKFVKEKNFKIKRQFMKYKRIQTDRKMYLRNCINLSIEFRNNRLGS